ncbi:MAG: hypothetical protein ACP5DC_03910 [Halothiobacillaceae bacterium]
MSRASRRGARRSSRWLVLVGLLLIGFAAWGPLLLVLGDSSAAEITELRRQGGTDEYARYFWNVSYRFRDADGAMHSGQARILGDAINPLKGRGRTVHYLPAAPWINALSFQIHPGPVQLALAAIGLFLIWSTRPGRPSARHGGRRKNPPGSNRTPAPQAPDDEAARRWLQRYPRRYRQYAWLFFILLVAGVGALLWWELDGFDADWFAAMTGFVLFTGLLMTWSGHRRRRAWVGIIEGKRVERRPIRDSDAQGQLCETAILEIRLPGRSHLLRQSVTPSMYAYFAVGDQVFKLAGFDYPEKLAADSSGRVCIVCGAILPADASGHCPRCRAPLVAQAILREQIKPKGRKT